MNIAEINRKIHGIFTMDVKKSDRSPFFTAKKRKTVWILERYGSCLHHYNEKRSVLRPYGSP